MRAATREMPRVVVVGAGISGLAMGIKLKRAGLDNFRILDAESGLGGTWRVNTYPGAAVDIASAIYQFGFRTHWWRRTHANQDEVLAYLEDVAEENGLGEHFTFDCRVVEARWDDEAHHYELATATGESIVCDVLVSAVGLLSNPQEPSWPGIESFEGPIFHTARWDHEADLTGARVAVVGVGSSAVQIVPAIAPEAQSVHVFQREPAWIVDKGDRPFTPGELRRKASPWYRRWERVRLITKKEWANWTGRPAYVAGSKRNKQAEARAREYIDTVFAERPDLREALTPSYPYEGKRLVQSSDFYPALLRDNVHLVPRAVAEVTPTGLVDVHGTKHEFDVIVTATGFTAASFLASLDVYGRNGRRLRDIWADGAFAFVGMTVPGFPNFYMQFGPNTNGAGAVSLYWKAEQQASWVQRDIRRMMRTGVSAVDTHAWATSAYNAWLQRRLQRTVWATANNYFKHPSGRIVTQFDGSITLQWILLRLGRRLGTFGRRRPSHRPG